MGCDGEGGNLIGGRRRGLSWSGLFGGFGTGGGIRRSCLGGGASISRLLGFVSIEVPIAQPAHSPAPCPCLSTPSCPSTSSTPCRANHQTKTPSSSSDHFPGPCHDNWAPPSSPPANCYTTAYPPQPQPTDWPPANAIHNNDDAHVGRGDISISGLRAIFRWRGRSSFIG